MGVSAKGSEVVGHPTDQDEVITAVMAIIVLKRY